MDVNKMEHGLLFTQVIATRFILSCHFNNHLGGFPFETLNYC